MKTVEHIEGLKPCRHVGRTWERALSGVMDCLGMGVTSEEERVIVSSFVVGQARWFRGHLLVGDAR